MALKETIREIEVIYPNCEITFHRAVNPAHKKLSNAYKYKFDAKFYISCENDRAAITCGEFKFVQKLTCNNLHEHPARRKEGTSHFRKIVHLTKGLVW